jgi:hypothetical protein
MAFAADYRASGLVLWPNSVFQVLKTDHSTGHGLRCFFDLPFSKLVGAVEES